MFLNKILKHMAIDQKSRPYPSNFAADRMQLQISFEFLIVTSVE